MIPLIFKASLIFSLLYSSYTEIQVLHCPEIETADSVEVIYDNRSLIQSTASFHCTNPEYRILGPITVSCLPNGQWSENPPKCIALYCPEIDAEDSVEVTYNFRRLIYSTARFRCSNLKSKISGPFEVSCLPNGKWSENPPTCIEKAKFEGHAGRHEDKSKDYDKTQSSEDDNNSSSSDEENNSSSSEEENNSSSSEEENNSSSSEEENNSSSLEDENRINFKPRNNKDSDRNNNIATDTELIRKNISLDHSEKSDVNRREDKIDSCTCTYEVNDPTLNAYVGDDLLHYGSQVGNGDIVKFRCSNVGYYRFTGLKETRCSDCKWQISKFPNCTLPTFYDAIIGVPDDSKNDVVVQSDGVIMVTPGATLTLRCTTFYTRRCPKWKIRTFLGTVYTNNCRLTVWGMSNTLTTLYKVKNAKARHSGRYECYVGYGKAHYVEVRVGGE